MQEVHRIEDQLKRAFEGEAWHGPSLRELLAGVTAQEAAAKPLPAAHSIWEIVLHVAAWEGAVRARLEGEDVKVPAEGDWPEVKETSAAAWQAALETLEEKHLKLIKTISSLDPSRLDEAITGSKSSVYSTLHGIIQHDLYHAGQIALLKKVLA